ncbi:MAG: hypothetical protein JJ992_09920, partial [Planctomycetes bacterium]|nr:hypothetical protein [Planctomycetota bacterium]
AAGLNSHIGQNAFATISGVQIEGNGNPSAGTDDRDELTINDTTNVFVRNLVYDYLDTANDLDILPDPGSANSGLFGSNGGGGLGLNVRTMETVIFQGEAANDDVVRVLGTSADDVLTVALRDSSSAALVFINGNPYTGAPPDSLSTFQPGIAGGIGRTGPDISIEGIGAAGITLDGSGTDSIGNRAIVQAASEDPVLAGSIDIFGFGPGVLIPGFGSGAAFDDIHINDTVSGPNRVTVTNTSAGPLVPVTIVPASFVNTAPVPPRPGLIVNAGDESGLRTTGPLAGVAADDIFATAHPQFNIAVNGNLPTLAFGPDGLPVGDQLHLVSPTSFSIWSDKSSPPNVSTYAGNDPFGIVDSSIERKLLQPGNGVLNLIGDQNNANIDQNDNFVVVGRNVDGNQSDGGYQEMTVSINGSSPILVEGVQFLNSYGFDLQGIDLINPGIDPKPDGGQSGIDTLDVRPYADNTPRGWGVHVNFNEGVPAGTDGDQADLLIYRTSSYGGPVSEGIVVAPSAADAGQVFSNNTSTGTPIVVVNYLANTDILVVDDDGFASDTDTLTLRGTRPDPASSVTGNELVVADFTLDGDSANPVVQVWDSQGTPATGDDVLLYRLRTNAVAGAAPLTFDTINIETLGGDDAISVVGRDDGSLTIDVDGGVGTDALVVPGTADGSDV